MLVVDAVMIKQDESLRDGVIVDSYRCFLSTRLTRSTTVTSSSLPVWVECEIVKPYLGLNDKIDIMLA